MSANLCIKPIYRLLEDNFYIPRYQRGYRWGKQEITELLNDLKEYCELISDRENKVSKFYCLQPVVVKEKEWLKDNETIKGWEVIDGQQRLTTLFLILNYLEPLRKSITFKHILDKEKVYSLFFETREDSEDFFKQKKFKDGINKDNVDYFHISNAYDIISNWFNENGSNYEILNTLLKEEYNVSVIWYEAIDEVANNNSEKSSIELFTRLNEGKIALTDAELIKALILQSDLYKEADIKYVKQRLFEIANEWDMIEAHLQDEKLWLFVNDAGSIPSSRIDYIFSLLADEWNEYGNEKLVPYILENGERVKPKHFEFIVFDKFLADLRLSNPDGDILFAVEFIWKKVKHIFNILFNWFNDHTLYHYIGYLFATERNKNKLLLELISTNEDKDVFLENLKKRIGEKLKITKKDKETGLIKNLEQLVYGSDNSEIINILLFFNVETIINHKKENARFPFHLYKEEKITSIEHIHPQNPEEINTDDDRALDWIESHIQSLLVMKNSATIDNNQTLKIDELLTNLYDLSQNYEKEAFSQLYSQVVDFYNIITDFKESQIHTLYNLALVDKDTNSKLNNSFFDIKRNLLRENDLNRYIPICTERAFGKYYTSNPKELIFWSNEDRKSYFAAIEAVYNSFVK
ncbi:DUF262 domain-containing protein [Empedobacter falsenii]|uniref:DUF262 domain-containing protein n=1 Tax=Empedobacter falsenii TaxID=343874 RepID=UPI001C8DCBCF|nr:DUF262 domain-containing protein [Empedobacter falsenii]MBY0066490.1 DUF262 domain-containing protein [Empedobacter falsenii]